MLEPQYSGSVAQLGERRPYKANVGSSNLSTPTTVQKNSCTEESCKKKVFTMWSGSSVG